MKLSATRRPPGCFRPSDRFSGWVSSISCFFHEIEMKTARYSATMNVPSKEYAVKVGDLQWVRISPGESVARPEATKWPTSRGKFQTLLKSGRFVSNTRRSAPVLENPVNPPIDDPSMDAVSESHTNFGTRFPRRKLMPYLRILVATADVPPEADLVSQKPNLC